MKWISVKDRKPKAPKGDKLGVPILVCRELTLMERQLGTLDRLLAYYGRRATGRPCFYLWGTELHGVTHWMPMPAPPEAER